MNMGFKGVSYTILTLTLTGFETLLGLELKINKNGTKTTNTSRKLLPHLQSW